MNFDQIDHFDGTTERKSKESPECPAPEHIAGLSPAGAGLGELIKSGL